MVNSISQPNLWFRRLQLLPIQRHGKGIDSGAKQFSDWASWKDTLLAERLVNGWSMEYWQ